MPARPPPLDDETLHALIPRLRRFARSLASDAAAVDVGVQFVVRGCFVQGLDGHRKAFRVDVGGVSSCIARSAWRARDNLDITVPTGMPSASAASR